MPSIFDRNYLGWVRRLRTPDLYLWLRAILVLLVAVQFVRLIWIVLTPVGPYGDWRPAQAVILDPAARVALFRGFDPYFRGGAAEAPVDTVTSLEMTLYGVRINAGSGRGSAIIAGPDGVQTSYEIGEEIAPGVTLHAVAFDHVVLERGGARESLYLDQSVPAETVGEENSAGGGEATSAAASSGRSALTADAVRNAVAFTPRNDGGRVTGIAVAPAGDSGLFEAAGLRAGDVIVAVNGRRIASTADAAALARQIRPGARISLEVERGATTVPIAINLE